MSYLCALFANRVLLTQLLLWK